MFELLFLLLPVAALYGWYMGRRSAQQHQQQEASRLSREYVTGVNFLLSNQQDKAVDLFLDMLKEDSNAFEAHLTLGNLFRSRGEVDRAIRLHQTLTESASLTYEQRLLAMQQLGRDYMVAGLYDRAEEMFRQLVEEADYRVGALKQLSLLYQATSEWEKAIAVTERLIKALPAGKTRAQQQANIAHFYCELAVQAQLNEDNDHALQLLKRAAAADKNCARVSIMAGRILLDRQRYEQAAATLENVLQQDKAFVGETLDMLQTCFAALRQPVRWKAWLQTCVEAQAGARAELKLAEVIEQEAGVEAAEEYVRQQLQTHPTMRLFHRLMTLYLQNMRFTNQREKQNLKVLSDIVDKQIHTNPHYCCRNCGFTTHTLYWHCPSCRSWASIKPVQGLDE